MIVLIVGVKKSETTNKKTGVRRDCFTIYYQRPFSDYDEENSECSGVCIGSEFTYKDYDVRPQDEVDLQFEPGYEGKAVLSNIVMVKPHIPRESKETSSSEGKASSGSKKSEPLPFN